MIECKSMMDIIIEDVEQILVGANEPGVLIKHQRCITVMTKQGETLYLMLRADEHKKLEFKEIPEPDWLTPKVYKGRSMHEQEMDDEK